MSFSGNNWPSLARDFYLQTLNIIVAHFDFKEILHFLTPWRFENTCVFVFIPAIILQRINALENDENQNNNNNNDHIIL